MGGFTCDLEIATAYTPAEICGILARISHWSQERDYDPRFQRMLFTTPGEVIECDDLSRAKLEEVLKDFGDKAAEADWAVIYYAAHGVEMNGKNYLVPVDASSPESTASRTRQ